MPVVQNYLQIVGYVFLGLLASAILLWLVSCFVASYFVYTKTLKRQDKVQWGRDLPVDMDPAQRPMYDAGLVWSDENIDSKVDLHIVNEGYNLYGEYYDFKKDRCAVILSGRTESLKYGYYFAIPYANNDCNILVLDQRSHGLSDGEYNTLGFEEHKDVIAWVKYIKENYNINSFVFHGICIGAANGMLALRSGELSGLVDGIVTEGMFANFSESVKNHMIERKKSTFLTLNLIDMWMRRYTGHSMKYGPIDFIDTISTPLLMLHSKEDIYSTPEYAQKLIDTSGAKLKQLVWFEHGKHSLLRITDTDLYDRSITDFLTKINSNKN